MEIKKRLIALDIGTKKIGVAVCDAMWLSATPLKTILRKNDEIVYDEIRKLCNEYLTDTIVVGIPYNMDGTLGFQSEKTLKFIKPLENEFTILYQDERLSSNTAEEILKNQGKKYTKDKTLVDMVAASIILQEYIDNNR